IREMDYHRLFIKFNVGTAHQACLNVKVRMRTEYCLSEWKRLESECEKQEFQDVQLKVVNDKVAELDADLAKMAFHLEEKLYPHLLTHGLKLVLIKCLNSSKYLTALGAAISHSIEKGMHDGLAMGSDHGREGRSLTDIAAYNPSAEADFNSAYRSSVILIIPYLPN
nr:cold-regulated 47 [Tanacetum cinerariifolium]